MLMKLIFAWIRENNVCDIYAGSSYINQKKKNQRFYGVFLQHSDSCWDRLSPQYKVKNDNKLKTKLLSSNRNLWPTSPIMSSRLSWYISTIEYVHQWTESCLGQPSLFVIEIRTVKMSRLACTPQFLAKLYRFSCTPQFLAKLYRFSLEIIRLSLTLLNIKSYFKTSAVLQEVVNGLV